MAARAVPARIVGYTKTHGIYQVLSETGKRTLAKDPRPIDKEDSDGEKEKEGASEWPIKLVQDLEDIAEGKQGRNYGWHCPEKEGCPEETHERDRSQEPQTPEKQRIPSPNYDSPSQQLFQEQNPEPPQAPQKPVVPEPRRSEQMGRDVTNWQD